MLTKDEMPETTPKLTDKENLARRGHGTHNNIKCWNRPEGCSCDTKPHMPFEQVKAEWVAWVLSKEGSPGFAIEIDSDSD